MSLSVKQLREFVAVAEAGSITRAAQTLYVAQPALSLAIRRLETQLGVTLFERMPRGVELTPEGAELLEPARRAVRDVDAVDASRTGAARPFPRAPRRRLHGTRGSGSDA